MENIKKIWDSLQEKNHLIETSMDALERKRTGSYYTHISLTDAMMHELVLKLLSGGKPIEDYRFLEPCVGTGHFVFSYLKEVNSLGIDKSKATKLLDNIYVADINLNALNSYMNSLKEIAHLYWDIDLDNIYFSSHIGSGLLIDVTAEKLNYIPITDIFSKEIVGQGFDIVVTNPPYKNLKAEKGHYINEEEYKIDQIKYNSISKIVSKKFKYSIDGTLNLYKLFVEEIIDNYTSPNAYISLLIPTSILSDKSCTKLRTHILTDMNLISVKIIGEYSNYIDAQQALNALLIHKGEKTQKVKVTKDYCKYPNEFTDIEIKNILNENTKNSIFAITKEEYVVLKKLREFPVIKDLNFITNLRGELDLTANKKYITTKNTKYRLLRGRNIDYYGLTNLEETEFVTEDFLKITKKSDYIKRNRIICQQIANIHKERRVTFALAPQNYILGNSCNFISVADNDYGIDIYTLLGLFNTRIINWLFKLTSSNNHVNNYEIDCFPIPVNSEYLKDISTAVQIYLETKDICWINKIECLAKMAYNLSMKNKEN